MNPEDDRLYNFLKVIGWFVLAAAIVIVVYIVITGLLPVNGQTPPAPTNPTPPPAQLPTPVPTPTPTQPNPNLQYLPQKAYVQAFAPENGIPANSQPLQVVPQTVPAPAQQQTANLGGNDIWTIINTLIAGGSGIMAKMGLDKAKKAQGTSQETAQTVVKVVEVQEEGLNLQFENMPQKGNEITNKPIIKQANVKEIKDKALETASKA